MAVLPDFAGVMGMSLKSSVWMMYWTIFGWTIAVLALLVGLHTMNSRPIFDVLIMQVTTDWFEMVLYTSWLFCVIWGFLALKLPVRPRAPKRAALMFWIFLILVHSMSHATFITMLCKRCHAFFLNSLAGNLTRETLETFASEFAKQEKVENFLYLTVPIMNWISAPFIFNLLCQLPPLNILFWFGWNWVIVAFVLGVIPILCYVATIPVVLGYVNAIDHGGNGSERCAPSKIELFYSLEFDERAEIRRGIKNVESFQYDLSTGDEASSGSSGEGSGGTHSSSLRSYTESEVSGPEEKGVKRIASYKPNRAKRVAPV